jgi:hypothetical protein
MNPSWLRLIYTLEFLVALIAVFTGWSQIGVQGHLDLIPWYWKAILGIGMSWTIVRATAAAIEHRRAWNARCIAWLLATLLFAAAMGIVTYYAHLHENDDEEDNTDNTTLTSAPATLPDSALL